MKNWKMRTVIILIVLVTALIGIGILFILTVRSNQSIMAYLLIGLLSFAAITVCTKPLNTVENAIVRLGNLDLSTDMAHYTDM